MTDATTKPPRTVAEIVQDALRQIDVACTELRKGAKPLPTLSPAYSALQDILMDLSVPADPWVYRPTTGWTDATLPESGRSCITFDQSPSDPMVVRNYDIGPEGWTYVDAWRYVDPPAPPAHARVFVGVGELERSGYADPPARPDANGGGECGMLIRTMPNGNDSVCTLPRGHRGDHGYKESGE